MAPTKQTVFVAVGSSINDKKIGYSTDLGRTWSESKQLNGLFSGTYGSGFGIAYDGIETFVAVGNNETDGQIGYSTDGGKSWETSKQLNGLFANGSGIDIAYDGINTFIAVGYKDGFGGQIGYSTDLGVTWLPSNTTLFAGGSNPDYSGCSGVAYDGINTFVVVGKRANNDIRIAYSNDTGITWTASTLPDGLFIGGEQDGAIGVAYGQETFVAVGWNGDNGQIGYSTDAGKSWQESTIPNELFTIGTINGVAYDGIGTFVAVGRIGGLDYTIGGQIGYSIDAGRTWIKSTQLNGLFTDSGGLGVAYGQETFMAVGESSQIGYSTDSGISWQVSNQVNDLFSEGFVHDVAFGLIPTPTPTPPISNICFPAGTPIKTDQGIIPIELINKEKHTIRNKWIKHLTQTVTLDKYLICFQPHSLGINQPSKQTIMTKDHKIFYKGELIPAYRFLNMSKHVKKVQYNGELLYNILLAEHGLMEVNNLQCETLSPENIIAQLYNNNYSPDKQDTIICSMNEALLKKDYPAYKQLIESTFTKKKVENERFSMNESFSMN